MAIKLCSPHEQRSPHDEQRSPHEQKPVAVVHDMNAILNEPIILNEPLLNNNNESLLLSELIRHFTKLTTFFPPQDQTPNYEAKWSQPLSAILARSGNDLGKAKETISAAVDLMISGPKKYRITSPKSIQTTAVNMLNGVGNEIQKDPTVANAWNEVKAAAANGGKPVFSDNRILTAVSPLWPSVKSMTSYTERELKTQFERNYNAIN
jgi:hypothetical protein